MLDLITFFSLSNWPESLVVDENVGSDPRLLRSYRNICQMKFWAS